MSSVYLYNIPLSNGPRACGTWNKQVPVNKKKDAAFQIC